MTGSVIYDWDNLFIAYTFDNTTALYGYKEQHRFNANVRPNHTVPSHFASAVLPPPPNNTSTRLEPEPFATVAVRRAPSQGPCPSSVRVPLALDTSPRSASYLFALISMTLRVPPRSTVSPALVGSPPSPILAQLRSAHALILLLRSLILDFRSASYT